MQSQATPPQEGKEPKGTKETKTADISMQVYEFAAEVIKQMEAKLRKEEIEVSPSEQITVKAIVEREAEHKAKAASTGFVTWLFYTKSKKRAETKKIEKMKQILRGFDSLAALRTALDTKDIPLILETFQKQKENLKDTSYLSFIIKFFSQCENAKKPINLPTAVFEKIVSFSPMLTRRALQETASLFRGKFSLTFPLTFARESGMPLPIIKNCTATAAVSADGRYVATGTIAGTLEVYDRKSKELESIPIQVCDPILQVAAVPHKEAKSHAVATAWLCSTESGSVFCVDSENKPHQGPNASGRVKFSGDQIIYFDARRFTHRDCRERATYNFRDRYSALESDIPLIRDDPTASILDMVIDKSGRVIAICRDGLACKEPGEDQLAWVSFEVENKEEWKTTPVDAPFVNAQIYLLSSDYLVITHADAKTQGVPYHLQQLSRDDKSKAICLRPDRHEILPFMPTNLVDLPGGNFAIASTDPKNPVIRIYSMTNFQCTHEEKLTIDLDDSIKVLCVSPLGTDLIAVTTQGKKIPLGIVQHSEAVARKTSSPGATASVERKSRGGLGG